MSQRKHPVSARAQDAIAVLGAQIAMARRERRWKSAELAARVGISLTTLRNVERGVPTVTIGVVFELAAILGVPLFAPEAGAVRDMRWRVSDRLALLPQRVYDERTEVDDDF